MTREPVLRRAARRLLQWAVHRSGRTPWGQALLGEFEETATTGEGVRWVLSGLPVLLRGRRTRRTILAWRLAYASVLGSAVLLGAQAFLVSPAYVPTDPNNPTLAVGDRVLVQHSGFDLHYGQIVQFHVSREFGRQEPMLRRIIGLPGDVIDCAGGHVLRNGEPLDEAYLPAGTLTACDHTTVPAGDIYVLGDNRYTAVDSRAFGVVAASAVQGRVVGRFWPLTRLGPVGG
ncbi:signal peptidase I [Hamadaea tsunoensis]|uniref:signal peptidase I n=1 Tax=Hamadaea tsunoensis TaxID=53368 RepID=UPI00040730A9|nr:signal peptidase I [Hamadaea tsunoensis]